VICCESRFGSWRLQLCAFVVYLLERVVVTASSYGPKRAARHLGMCEPVDNDAERRIHIGRASRTEVTSFHGRNDQGSVAQLDGAH